MDKKELNEKLNFICDEIMAEIIEPVCNFNISSFDYWLSDIATFTGDNENLNQEIYSKLQEKYNLTNDDLISIDSFTPLIQIALFIYMEEYRPQYGEI